MTKRIGSQKTWLGGVAALLLLTQAGCTFSLRDAVAAGLFDFVSAAVAETLASFNPLSIISSMLAMAIETAISGASAG